MALLSRRRSVAALAALTAATATPMRLLAQQPPAPLPEPPLPGVQAGSIERVSSLLAFAPAGLDARPVDVWLPEGYAAKAQAGQRFPVIYMHDGQNLLDTGAGWNKQSWHVDRALTGTARAGQAREAIVVAIWNNGKLRAAEYYPEKFLALLPAAQREAHLSQRLLGKPLGDAYLRFIVQTLKPLIDARYATRPGREHSFTMGSSMGGLISVYALCEYPQVFGGAAGLSTHWVGSHQHNAALPLAAFNYLQANLPAPQGFVRLYQDHGTRELDALYAPYQRFVDEIVRGRGYGPAQYLSRVFEGTGHNEHDWAARLEIPLQFLLAGGA